METADSTCQEEASLEFDFNFDDDNLMENPHIHKPLNDQPGETTENISSQEYVELGSSSGSNQPLINRKNSKPNLAPSTMTSSGLSDTPQPEHAPNLAQPATSFNPSLDYAELQSPGGYSQPKPNVGNQNSNYSQHAYNTSEDPSPAVVSTPSLQQLGQSSLNSTLMGEPQPHPPTMEKAELRSLGGSNWSCLNSEGSSQNLKQSALSSLECFNTSLATSPNVGGLLAFDGAVQSFQAHEVIYPNQLMNARPENVPQIEHMPLPQSMRPLNECSTNNQIAKNITSNNFSSISQQQSLCPTLFPQNPMGFGVTNQRPLLINQQQATLLPHNQNTPYRPFSPLGPQANEFMTANVYDSQCINFMQPQSYAFLRPQQSSNQLQQLNQAPQTTSVFDPQCHYSMLPGLSMPFRPRSFLHHQFDQVPVPPNVYDPQGYNSMLPELSILARPPQLANYHQQPNQLWTTQNSLLPGSSMPSRLQQFCGRQQLNQSTHLMPNVFNPQLGASMLPEPIMLSGRSQLLDHYEQSNQVSMTPCVCNPLQHNSIASGPAALPRATRLYDHQHLFEQFQDSQFCSSMRPQQSSLHQRLNQVTETAIGIDPQHHNILLPDSSTPFSLQTIQTHGFLNQTGRQSIPYLSSGTNAQQTQILNLQTEREIGGGKNRVAISDLSETSLRGFKEKGLVEGHRRAAKRHLLGESSLSSKRSMIETIWGERSLQDEERTSQSEGNEVENSILSNPSYTRPTKNAVYDPTFEGIGLPVDPHLRLFASC
ncbi:uncharacterized protein LOC132170565 [Corylus avellana]|uniref:uncharacterized protein LOC132170565 n=1 Tax=Corylus avellana TaxID=13451 RepID=UPI00286BCFC2|nr:uncharacterized protein LOC132170565 [Corylus avellana]